MCLNTLLKESQFARFIIQCEAIATEYHDAAVSAAEGLAAPDALLQVLLDEVRIAASRKFKSILDQRAVAEVNAKAKQDKEDKLRKRAIEEAGKLSGEEVIRRGLIELTRKSKQPSGYDSLPARAKIVEFSKLLNVDCKPGSEAAAAAVADHQSWPKNGSSPSFGSGHNPQKPKGKGKGKGKSASNIDSNDAKKGKGKGTGKSKGKTESKKVTSASTRPSKGSGRGAQKGGGRAKR